MAIFVSNGPVLTITGQNWVTLGNISVPVLVVIVFTQRLSVIRIQSVTVFTNFTYLWRDYSEGQRSRSSKNEGQGHKKLRTQLFCTFFMVNFLTHGAYSGSCHSSKVKGQGHLKVKFGAIVSYH